MPKPPARSAIRLKGVRHHNLKNFNLDLPLNRLIVITGLSGSGKSSLAFDTLFAEGQRRYIETFSPYARQFFDRMDKPQVDSIEGIPPAIAIEQRNAVKTTRSTVGTMTEICDHMKVVWSHLAELRCRQCGRRVCKDSPQRIWDQVRDTASASAGRDAAEVLITFDIPLSDKLPLTESLALIAKQGYQRVLLKGEILRLAEIPPESPDRLALCVITVLQDRVKIAPANRSRFTEACEQAYHFGKGKLAIHFLGAQTNPAGPLLFSNRFHCAECDIDFREPSPALFSFNHPIGACPACKGFGRVISIDYDLAVPDRTRTIAQGVVRPWLTGTGAESQADLLRACRKLKVPTDVPFEQLPKKWQDFVINGEPDYGTDPEHEWPRAWYGVKGYFRWLESKAYKMHVRVLLSRYRAYTLCPSCGGARLQPEALLYRLPSADKSASGLTLSDFYQLSTRDALAVIECIVAGRTGAKANEPISLVLSEVRSRLRFLNDIGLGYLTLDRPTRSLSGGETERVNLTTCLGTRLVNTLFVLDEPSVGLHPRDTDRLIRILEQLRDAGNTVVVVEHEASVMRAADQLVDIGPGHGATGGNLVFQGTFAEILNSGESLTGKYLGGRTGIEIPERRPVSFYNSENSSSEVLALNEAAVPFGKSAEGTRSLTIRNASRHNLQNVSADIPLSRFVAVTGVSGSGKTTLIREVLLPVLEAKLRSQNLAAANGSKASQGLDEAETSDESADAENVPASGSSQSATLSGVEHLDSVVLVDQSSLGKTPRSNPAVYTGAFDDIREVFAQSEIAKQRGLNASAFSFNSGQGQCERCRGAGFEKIEMQFLSDVFIRCPDCNGRRYRQHILTVKINGTAAIADRQHSTRKADGWSIADTLDATVDEVVEFLAGFPESKPARRATSSLQLLQEVGLGYLKLGQPINTLSGGESQRLKLVRHLTESSAAASSSDKPKSTALFLFDEPTTGLHFDDVRVLLKVFQRLVDAGHSVLVIEHNIDVIKCADWVIDLGPDAGDAGGRVVVCGTPEEVAACEESHTGAALRSVLNVESLPPRANPHGRFDSFKRNERVLS
ncbi:MAG TPA: excinuclease ABC subunit UvrA [Verrucomicrobiae bacterium]|nr:excinuclease ABC subunit UvrA [Verrucomicrobiae bacterium]